MSLEELQIEVGVISKIIYNNDNFIIGILQKNNRENITFRGSIIGLEKNEEIILKGQWTYHVKYGHQFEVKSWERPIPKTKDKIIAYLTSPFVKGCGKKKAEKIVNKLGVNAIEIIMDKREKALEGIKGIGEKRANSIVESVLATYELQNIIADLSGYGIKPEFIIKLYKKYGSETSKILKKNPYILTELKLISFPKADEIAMKMNIFPLSSYRIEACIDFMLNKYCFASGHCFIGEEELIKITIEMLNQNKTENDKVNKEDVMQSIFNLEEKKIIIEDGKVYPKSLFVYETGLANKLHNILSSKHDKLKDDKIDLYIKEYQLKEGLILANEQKEAIKTALKNNVTVITGSAGTGKTTIVKAIIEIYQKLFPKRKISLSAPTGRASRKLQKVTGHFAQTNHRLLGYKQDEEGKSTGFEYNENNKLAFDFYIIDEMSMVDLHMAYSLTAAMENNSKVLFIGDVNQLPSINSGNVLKDLLETSNLPTVHLKQIYRQAENSQIITNSNRVNKGLPITVDHSKGDMYFINQQEDKNISNMIIRSILRFIELGHDPSDILVLSPMKKGVIGTIELNKRLQNVLNPKTKNKKEVEYGEKIFRVGDKIMQTVNKTEKGIFNGDIGIITDIEIEKINENGKEVKVYTIHSDFQGVQVTHTRDEWNQIELGYSISIHKSQGGQAPIVIIPISMGHYNMLARNLIYTGMTRAEKKLVLIGQQQAMNVAINNNKITIRNTRLRERLENLIDQRAKLLGNG